MHIERPTEPQSTIMRRARVGVTPLESVMDETTIHAGTLFRQETSGPWEGLIVPAHEVGDRLLVVVQSVEIDPERRVMGTMLALPMAELTTID